MGRGIRVLVLLAALVTGLALLMQRDALYEATATATAADDQAAARVEARAAGDAFAQEVAETLSAARAADLPALEVTRTGADVRVTARDVDPGRATDTVDTAVHLLAGGATADDVEDTSSSMLPTDPVNRSSLTLLGAALGLLVVLGAIASRVVPRRPRRATR